MAGDESIGQIAARMKWLKGHTWEEVVDAFPGKKYEAIRSAARVYKKEHPEEFDGPQAQSIPSPINGTHINTDRENVTFAQYGGEEKKRLNDFVEEMNPDPAIWIPHRPGIKKHVAWRKREEKDLIFDQGVISGHVKSGGILAVDFYNMWCSYIRKELKPVLPTIKPVVFSHKFKTPKRTSAKKKTCRTLVISDAQIGFRKDPRNGQLTPFHDRLALDIICQIVAQEWFDRLDIAGDLVDFTECTTKFAKEPEFHMTTQPTIYEAAYWLARLRSSSKNPSIEIVYEEGNHEIRLCNFVSQYFYPAHGLTTADNIEAPILSVPFLLGLDSLGIRYVGGYPDAFDWLTPSIKVGHSEEYGDNAARNIMKRSRVSVIFGHPHRKQQHWISVLGEDGGTVPAVGVSFGWLGLGGEAPGSDERDDWHKGFGIVEYQDGRLPSIEQVSIDNGAALWRGKVWEGKSPIKDIAVAFPDWGWY